MTADPEEFTTITVDLREEGSTIILEPSDNQAASILQQVLDTAPSSFNVNYDGFTGSISAIYLHFGGERYHRVIDGYLSIDYRGALKVRLDLSEARDRTAVESLRLLVGGGARVAKSATLERFALTAATPTRRQ